MWYGFFCVLSDGMLSSCSFDIRLLNMFLYVNRSWKCLREFVFVPIHSKNLPNWVLNFLYFFFRELFKFITRYENEAQHYRQVITLTYCTKSASLIQFYCLQLVFVLDTTSFRKIFVIFASLPIFVGFRFLFTVSKYWAVLWSFEKSNQ